MKRFGLLAALVLGVAFVAQAQEEKIVGGGLDPKVVHERVRSALKDNDACLRKARDEKSAAGLLVTQFSVNFEGRVSDAKVMKSTIANPKIETCVLNALKSAQFPEPVGHGTVTITKTLAFTARGELKDGK